MRCYFSLSGVEKETMQGTMPGARRRGRPRTAWTDNIKTWTGLPVEESITEDRDEWRKYVRGVDRVRLTNRTVSVGLQGWSAPTAFQSESGARNSARLAIRR